ncbi:hypothetical protein [Streptomyces sp. WAC 06738]|uniref:hypothetical protein n=1 Tax=Streptomyces sp. WAC 06738 TaxID=2203210 RepID=UPI0013E0832A|nr:hypothetical protein [Streptomyces sp. WAC 06738]
MTFQITDKSGQPRTFLEWTTAAALAVGKVKVTDQDGRTVEIDPATIGGTK